jgi:ABC-2 type transport system ATP-binding protein
MAAIEVRDVHKVYGELEAVRGVDLRIAAGELFCLLGPNGAGKTTLVEMMEGHRLPSSGSISLLGEDPGKGDRDLRDRIGVVLQETAIQEELTVGELLAMYGAWYSRPRPAAEVIELVELDAKRGTRVGQLSGGQRRRLDLALALVGSPDLLFLDEPTTGFDPQARRHAWSTIRSLCGDGMTVVLTTHYMDEAQQLADRVAVMVKGEVVADGTPDELGGRDELPTEIRFELPASAGLSDLPTLPGSISVDGSGVLVTSTEGLTAVHIISSWALARGLPLADLSVSQPTLEDVYLALTAETRQEALA